MPTSRKKKDVFTVTYGMARKWSSREEAIAFFREAVEECDGCERERYMFVLIDLLDGKVVCTDHEE